MAFLGSETNTLDGLSQRWSARLRASVDSASDDAYVKLALLLLPLLSVSFAPDIGFRIACLPFDLQLARGIALGAASASRTPSPGASFYLVHAKSPGIAFLRMIQDPQEKIHNSRNQYNGSLRIVRQLKPTIGTLPLLAAQ